MWIFSFNRFLASFSWQFFRMLSCKLHLPAYSTSEMKFSRAFLSDHVRFFLLLRLSNVRNPEKLSLVTSPRATSSARPSSNWDLRIPFRSCISWKKLAPFFCRSSSTFWAKLLSWTTLWFPVLDLARANQMSLFSLLKKVRGIFLNGPGILLLHLRKFCSRII